VLINVLAPQPNFWLFVVLLSDLQIAIYDGLLSHTFTPLTLWLHTVAELFGERFVLLPQTV